jgi:hypothetical protein
MDFRPSGDTPGTLGDEPMFKIIIQSGSSDVKTGYFRRFSRSGVPIIGFRFLAKKYRCGWDCHVDRKKLLDYYGGATEVGVVVAHGRGSVILWPNM